MTDHLGQVWQSEAAFVFCNRARTRLKLLRWDKHGVWLGVRRLHRGRFIWPQSEETTWSLTHEQFSWLVKGINWQQVEGENLLAWR
ncbi:MAG: IS66 family insertion sequence element accessory protein TnpB [Enterobacteriaceae bacterium]